METNSSKLNLVREHIKSYKDFPKQGIVFRDIFSVLLNNQSFKALCDLVIDHIKKLDKKFDAVVGLESRGFLLGPLVALEFSLPFVPIRKKGKLPGPVTSVAYSLEYSTDVFEMQRDSLKEGQTVLIIDDLLATGGSLKASCDLLSSLKIEVAECLVIMELNDLRGRDNVPAPVYSMVQF
ncbi:adenine phosphoribosyltransferase [Rhodnius prolixus]|uniref:Adenine phosphoribosyltransferase n=2 Tax=Rhodnius TaxID=13248 RepID=T1HBI5_RHOPR